MEDKKLSGIWDLCAGKICEVFGIPERVLYEHGSIDPEDIANMKYEKTYGPIPEEDLKDIKNPSWTPQEKPETWNYIEDEE